MQRHYIGRYRITLVPTRLNIWIGGIAFAAALIGSMYALIGVMQLLAKAGLM